MRCYKQRQCSILLSIRAFNDQICGFPHTIASLERIFLLGNHVKTRTNLLKPRIKETAKQAFIVKKPAKRLLYI